jgi:hypothetical protein
MSAPSFIVRAPDQDLIWRQKIELESFAHILGALFVDEWDREVGASAAHWISRNGRTLLAAGTPTYAPDGTNFSGGSVIGTNGSTSWMAGVGLPSMAASGSHPYLCGVARFSPIGGLPVAVSLAGAADQLVVFANNVDFFGQITGTGITGPASDNAVHFYEVWPDGTDYNFALDGVLSQLVHAGGTTQAATAFIVGNRAALDLPMEGFHSRYVVASAPPSPSQRAALLALARFKDGF